MEEPTIILNLLIFLQKSHISVHSNLFLDVLYSCVYFWNMRTTFYCFCFLSVHLIRINYSRRCAVWALRWEINIFIVSIRFVRLWIEIKCSKKVGVYKSVSVSGLSVFMSQDFRSAGGGTSHRGPQSRSVLSSWTLEMPTIRYISMNERFLISVSRPTWSKAK